MRIEKHRLGLYRPQIELWPAPGLRAEHNRRACRNPVNEPVPHNGVAHPRPTSLTTNIRIPARKLVVEPRVRLLPRHRRSLLRRVEPPHRPALDHHVHRPPGLGQCIQCMVISAGWYYAGDRGGPCGGRVVAPADCGGAQSARHSNGAGWCVVGDAGPGTRASLAKPRLWQGS